MKNKIDSLQIIRAFAFIGIFVSHSGISLFSIGGVWGVSVFFVMSGFLMMYSYYDTDRIKNNGILYSIKFGINKIKRLYPLHIITLLMAMPFLGVGYLGMEKIIKIFSNVFLVQSWFPDRGIYFSLNAVSWYLSASLFLYILFPFILSCVKKYRSINTAVLVIVVIFTIQTILAYSSHLLQGGIIQNDSFIHWFTYIFPLSRLEDFIIGCNLGYIFINARKDKEANQKLYTFLECMVIIIIVISWIANYFIDIPSKANPEVGVINWWGYTVIWTITSCILVYLFALNKGVISKVLTIKPIICIGNLSAKLLFDSSASIYISKYN